MLQVDLKTRDSLDDTSDDTIVADDVQDELFVIDGVREGRRVGETHRPRVAQMFLLYGFRPRLGQTPAAVALDTSSRRHNAVHYESVW